MTIPRRRYSSQVQFSKLAEVSARRIERLSPGQALRGWCFPLVASSAHGRRQSVDGRRECRYNVDMPSTPAFAHIQPGLLPTGTVTSYGEIVAVSCTAYKVADGRWLSYDTFHGRPAPVMPLVVLR